MKYIISESRLERLMEKVFDQYINVDELKYYHPVEEDDNGDEYDDLNRIVFYVGDIEYEEDVVFRYYECDYFDENAREVREKCPILSIDDDRIIDTFNSLFDDLWKEPFRKWINERLDLSTKTIE